MFFSEQEWGMREDPFSNFPLQVPANLLIPPSAALQDQISDRPNELPKHKKVPHCCMTARFPYLYDETALLSSEYPVQRTDDFQGLSVTIAQEMAR